MVVVVMVVVVVVVSLQRHGFSFSTSPNYSKKYEVALRQDAQGVL